MEISSTASLLLTACNPSLTNHSLRTLRKSNLTYLRPTGRSAALRPMHSACWLPSVLHYANKQTPSTLRLQPFPICKAGVNAGRTTDPLVVLSRRVARCAGRANTDAGACPGLNLIPFWRLLQRGDCVGLYPLFCNTWLWQRSAVQAVADAKNRV